MFWTANFWGFAADEQGKRFRLTEETEMLSGATGLNEFNTIRFVFGDLQRVARVGGAADERTRSARASLTDGCHGSHRPTVP